MSAPATSRAGLAYGLSSLLLAGLYAYVLLALVPSRSAAINAALLGLCGVMAAGGVGMLVPRRWARGLALASSLVLLLGCGVLILLLLASAAYLHGIYGGVGQAGSAMALILAALLVEALGLLPALQLALLLRWRRQERSAAP